MVTDRMLGMFVRKPKPAPTRPPLRVRAGRGRMRDGRRDARSARAGRRRRRRCSTSLSFSLFIYGLMQGTHPTHGQERQPDRRRRHGDRGDHHAAARRDRQLGRDHRRARGRLGGRRDRLDPRADDRDAADGGALQRRRRRRRRADRLVGVPPRNRLGGDFPARRADPDPVRGRRRLGLLLGLEHRLRQAPGPDPDAAARGPGPAGDQRRAAGRDPRRLRRPRRPSRRSLAGPLHRWS